MSKVIISEVFGPGSKLLDEMQPEIRMIPMQDYDFNYELTYTVIITSAEFAKVFHGLVLD